MKGLRKIIRRRLLRAAQSDADNGIEAVEQDNDMLRPDDMCGVWESINLNPSLIIYRDHSKYLLSIIHIASSGQASPSTYEVQSDENGYFITPCGRRTALSHDHLRDELSLDGYGCYMRN